ncbi:SDR family oxidoreductase [Actinoplanes sp. NPDC026619]|uniref:SDR family NAD(P)-dependent oxidoreductase n=1 Tax=Actinoplanes sp. NPDC026619 TaxID=3155798 RepID=UPI0033E486B1
MSDWLELAGRRAVVAGAGGIGAALVTALAGAGAEVAVLDRDEERLAAIESEGIHPVRADLTSPVSCRDAVAEAEKVLGGVEIFVHAVGMNDRRPVLDTPDEVWERIIAINLNSGFWLGRAVGERLVTNGYGRMVYLSSVSGLLAHKDHSPYAASKGGVNQLMRVMAREWAPHGVTVNAVAPGYIETGLTAAYLAKPGMRSSMEELVPAGRLGVPADLVGPVLLLCSDRSAFMTGQVLYIDGGRTLV